MSDIEIIHAALQVARSTHWNMPNERLFVDALAALDRLSAPPSESARELAIKLQVASEEIAEDAPSFKNRAEMMEYYETHKRLEIEAHAALIESSWARVREEVVKKARNCPASRELDEVESWGWQLGRDDAIAAILAQPKEEKP